MKRIASASMMVALLSGCGSEANPAVAPAADGGSVADAGSSTSPDGGAPPTENAGPCSHPDCPVSTLLRGDVSKVRAASLVLTADRVIYYNGGSLPGIFSIPKTGGAAPTKLAELTSTASGGACKPLATDGTDVYFVKGGAAPALARVPVGGGATEVIVDKVTACPTIEGGDLIWSEPDANGTERRGLWKRALSGGTPTRIVEDTIGPYVGHGASFYWFNTQGLETAPKTGGVPTKINTGPSLPSRTVADDTSVYVFESPNLYRVPYDGSDKTIVAFDPHPIDTVSIGLLTDGTTLYWIQRDKQGGSGPIMRRPTSAPAERVTYGAMLSAVDLAVDEEWLYWSDDIGEIRRVQK